MRICIFSRAFFPSVGGLEGMARMLAESFMAMGHCVEVVTDTPADERETLSTSYSVVRTRSLGARLQAFRRADVVLFMNISLHGVVATLLARAPIVFSHHGVYRREDLLGKLVEFGKRQLTRWFPNIAVSAFVASRLPGYCHVVPNAYDESLFVLAATASRDFDFVFCGRLVSDKGVDICIDAFATLATRFPGRPLTLTVIGDGPERRNVQNAVVATRLEQHVRVLGQLEGKRLVEELKRHSCMVIPSRVEEGFGIVALEGIACCDTVIASRRGGLPEAIGSCGVLVEPTVENLFEAMRDVVLSKWAGGALPGQIDDPHRITHLARHSPLDVAQRYAEILGQTSDRAPPISGEDTLKGTGTCN